MPSNAIEALKTILGDRLVLNEPLARHTTFGIGGPADGFVVAHTLPELCELVRLAWEKGVPYFILGGGANLLVSDRGIRGLVIQNRCAAVEIVKADEAALRDGRYGELGEASESAWLLKAESGAALRSVARQAVAHGLAGLEWAVDVPGTVGGAVVGNAGAFGGYVSDSLYGVYVFSPEGGQRWWPSRELKLTYRSSIFKSPQRITRPDAERREGQGKKSADFSAVILSATFALHPEDSAVLQAKVAAYSKRRAESQPPGLSAGSVFKRTEQYPAGFLIENAGLKGARVGGAVVSTMHANFIINQGMATASDVQQLIELIRTTVYARFRIMLELEIELVGEW